MRTRLVALIASLALLLLAAAPASAGQTDGGLFGSLVSPAASQGPPSVVRLEVGIPGLPLPGTRK